MRLRGGAQRAGWGSFLYRTAGNGLSARPSRLGNPHLGPPPPASHHVPLSCDAPKPALPARLAQHHLLLNRGVCFSRVA